MVETEDLTRWCEKPESSQDVFAAPVWTHQLEFTRLRGRESKRRQWGEQQKSNPEALEAEPSQPRGWKPTMRPEDASRPHERKQLISDAEA